MKIRAGLKAGLNAAGHWASVLANWVATGVACALTFATVCAAVCPSAQATPVRVLISAFEPFAGEAGNASQAMLDAFESSLAGDPLPADVEIHTVILPVVYGQAPALLNAQIDLFRPQIVLALGQAPGDSFRVERQAFNQDNETTPDNAGQVHAGVTIVKGGPWVLGSTLPTFALDQSIAQAGYSVTVSDSAGAYLCNDVFYSLMFHVRSLDVSVRPARAGFMHVPMIPSDEPDYAAWGRWGRGALRAAVERLTVLP